MASVNLDLEEGGENSGRNGLIERIEHVTPSFLLSFFSPLLDSVHSSPSSAALSGDDILFTRINLDRINPFEPASLAALKGCVISKLKWCKQNKLQVCLYVGIILYCGALFATDGSFYVRMVTYVAPCLTALPALTQFHEQFRDIGNNLQRLEQLIRDLSASLRLQAVDKPPS